jgi:hypothetical protein
MFYEGWGGLERLIQALLITRQELNECGLKGDILAGQGK